jgi:hypothetical protein
LFTWRREARKAAQALPTFVPAVVAPEPVLAADPRTAEPACAGSLRYGATSGARTGHPGLSQCLTVPPSLGGSGMIQILG